MIPHIKLENMSNSLHLAFLVIVTLYVAVPLFAIDSLQVDWATYIGGSEGIDVGGVT